MQQSIYSSNSQEAILQDYGPYKQSISDNSFKGCVIYKFEQVTDTVIVGEKINFETEKVAPPQDDMEEDDDFAFAYQSDDMIFTL